MQQNIQPKIQNLVLIGGGHSHAIVLKMFGIKSLPNVRLTLITVASDTAYLTLGCYQDTFQYICSW